MPIDTSIYSQIQPPKLESPLNALAQVMQVQQAQSQNRLADLTLANQQRDYEESNNFRNALGGLNMSDPASVQAALPKLLQASPKLGMALQKQLSEQSKVDAQAMKDKMDALGKAFSVHRDALTAVDSPQAAAAWVKSGYADPLLGSVAAKTGSLEDALARIPTDAKGFAEWKQRNMLGAEKLMQYLTPDANAKLSADTSRANNAATNAVTMRGQNMTDARAREQIAAGRIPAGYRMKADGTGLEPIPGGPAEKDKAPTEFQGKSAAFGARAEAADKILAGLEGKYSPAKVNAKQGAENAPLVGGIIGPMTNKYVLSAEDQKAEQAQRDFVNAVLRQESGAAISAPEFENAKKQYFPQPGDGPEVIAQKAANRRLAIQGFKNNAGKAFTGAQAPAGGGWSIVEVK